MRRSWSGALVFAGVVAVMTPAILLAASGSVGGFDAVVHDIETRYHARASRIPFMGLISGIAGIATHGGVRNLHVAEFEDMKERVDGTELNEMVEHHIGGDWKRIVRETSRGGNEQSLIYVRAEGDHMGMLVVDLDGKELDVVQLSINPDQLSREIKAHEKHPAREDDGAGKSEGDQGAAGDSE